MTHRRDFIRFLLAGGAAAGLTTMLPAPARALASPQEVIPRGSRQPSFHRSQSSGTPMGTLRIPSIGVEETVRSGVAIDVINRGVAHWVGTALPGEDGNVVLAGHRTTYTRPFYNLGEIDVGDLIVMTDNDGREILYRAAETFIVEPTDLWITYDRDEPMLTMFACHPKGSTRYRIVVTAELVGRGLVS